MTAFGPRELVDLRLFEFVFTTCNPFKCIWITGHIRRCDGSAKTRQGKLKMVNYKPPEITVWNMNQVSGTVSVFRIWKYISISLLRFVRSRTNFFCAVKYGESVTEKVLKIKTLAATVSKNTFWTHLTHSIFKEKELLKEWRFMVCEEPSFLGFLRLGKGTLLSHCVVDILTERLWVVVGII